MVYEIKLNIEEHYFQAFLAHLQALNYAHIESIVQKRKRRKQTLSKNQELLNTLPLDSPLRPFLKPLRDSVTPEDLIFEQKYVKTDWDKLNQLAQELDIQEPTEVLLAQLSK